jgi:polyferredoxin
VKLYLYQARKIVQHLSFAVLIYGGRLGINLGPAIPCLACPFVSGCGGQCYLMGLQGYIGFGMTYAVLGGSYFLRALLWMAVFVLLTSLFGKMWCGWACPLGLVQDWLSALRRKLGVRERVMTPALQKKLSPVKYVFLASMAVVPPLVTAGILRNEFSLPFCNICPGKSLLPLLSGNARYLSLNTGNSLSLVLSIALLTVTGIVLVGSFFKDRFYCVFCPMRGLIALLKPLSLIRLVKEPRLCNGCAVCRRACPMNIEKVYREREKNDVQTALCVDCFTCAETCPTDSALSVRFLGKRLFTSRRLYAAKRSARQ